MLRPKSALPPIKAQPAAIIDCKYAPDSSRVDVISPKSGAGTSVGQTWAVCSAYFAVASPATMAHKSSPVGEIFFSTNNIISASDSPNPCAAGVPATLESRPIIVLAAINTGAPFPGAPCNARFSLLKSSPRTLVVRHPAARIRSGTSISVNALPSILMPLSSQIKTRLSNLYRPAKVIASAATPSLKSPSLHRQYTIPSVPRIFSASAIPTALPTPCPNGPVVAKTPSIPYSGCPGNPPSFLKLFKSPTLYPANFNTAYSIALPWPADKTKRSRPRRKKFA